MEFNTIKLNVADGHEFEIGDTVYSDKNGDAISSPLDDRVSRQGKLSVHKNYTYMADDLLSVLCRMGIFEYFVEPKPFSSGYRLTERGDKLFNS